MIKNSARTIIIGGGLSGLALAARIPNSLLISESEIGGLILNTVKDGFSFDFGGHVYTTTDDRINNIMSEIPEASYHKERKAFFTLDKKVPFPVQDNAHQLGLVVEPHLIQNAKFLDVKNFSDYSNMVLGEEFTQGFMRPFNERVWSTSMEDMDFDWTMGRVKAPSASRTNWGMNSSFWYATGHQIAYRMYIRAIGNGTTFVSGEVVDINLEGHRITAKIAGEVVEYTYTQLFDTAGIFNKQPTNMVLSIGVGLDSKIDYDFDWTYLKFGQSAHRVTLLSRYAEGLTPHPWQDSLLFEVPFTHSNARSMSADIKKLTSSAANGSEKLFIKKFMLSTGFSDAEKFDVKTVWMNISRGYPIPVVGHRVKTRMVKRALLSKDVFLCGRWGAHGYYNFQHILDDADAAVAAANNHHLSPYLTGSFYYKES